ncbi:MAG TPA: M48 family metalloprotease [Thermoanaerobaculia bacterium]|nr:M48 family metalloprotease [Thermoanaerobaculia bacterium]
MRAAALIVASTAVLAVVCACTAAGEGGSPATAASGLAFGGPFAEGNASDRGVWWVDTYGAVDPAKDARAALAQGVFERMSAAVDKRGNRLPRLVVVGAPKDPFAVALPDGSIVLTRGALDFCYGLLPMRKPTDARGDLRLAFVLGHELAHLASDDFWHRAAFAEAERIRTGSRERGPKDRIIDPPSPHDLQLAELKADSGGVITMAMAGYSPDELFDVDPNFFQGWVRQAGGLGAAYDDDPAHPQPEKRAKLVLGQLAGLAEEVELFHVGVRLAQLGRYTDAVPPLERFCDHFAGREVLSDLGYVHYQLAMKALAACDGAPTVRFRLPVAIDDETLADRARLRGGSSTCLESEPVRKSLGEARRYLELAKEKDSAYLPARRNLLALELISGKSSAALALAEETLSVAPRDSATLLAKGVALYLFGIDFRMETIDEALKLLAEAEADPARAADAVFARAEMLNEHGRIAGARAAWLRFLELEPHGSYADFARERLGLAAEAPAVPGPVPAPPIPLGVVGPKTSATLARLDPRPFDIGQGAVYRSQGLWVLQLGDAIEVVVQWVSPTNPGPQPPQGGVPVRVETRQGVFLRYPGVAFDMVRNRVRAVVYFAPAR